MNIKQHKFVTEYLRFSDKIVAYHNAYPNPNRKDRATESAANRLMQHPEVSKAIADAQETCMSRAMEDLKDKMKEELLTVYQKRLVCKRVVLGEVREEVVYKGKGCTHCSYFREIPYSIKLRYAKEDSLLAGHYPDKRAKKHNPPIETCNKTQQPNEVSSLQQIETHQPLQQNMSPLLEDRGTVRDVPAHSTNETPEKEPQRLSVSAVKKETQESHNNPQQNTECPPRACPELDSGGVAKHEPGVGTRDIHSHNTNETPEKETQRLSVSAVKHPHTITHAGLRKLFNKQRIKKQQPLIFAPCV